MRLFPAALLLGALALSSCRCGDGGLGALHPLLVASTNALHFDDTFEGATRPLVVTITDAGSAPVEIDTALIDDPAFSLAAHAPAGLVPGQSVDVTVVFTPKVIGAVTAHLVITSNAENARSLAIELVGKGLRPLDCNDHNECTDEHFDPVSGSCIRSDHVGSCDDGSACTENDRCFQGACVGDAVVCTDTQDCTRNTCDPNSGCLFIPDDTLCTDPDPCSLDRCDAVFGCTHDPAPDGTPCGSFAPCQSVDLCIAHICTPVAIPDGTPCSDGDICTIDDSCVAGACVGTSTVIPPAVLVETHRLVAPRGAAFIGDTLFMSDDTVKVVPLVAGQPRAFPTSSITAIPGHGQLLASGTHLVSVGVTNDGARARIIVVDPFATPPAVLADVDAGTPLRDPRPAVLSADGNTLYARADDAAGGMYALSLVAPFASARLPTSYCPPALQGDRVRGTNGTVALDLSADFLTLHVHTLTPTAVVDEPDMTMPESFGAILVGSDRAVVTLDASHSVALDISDPAHVLSAFHTTDVCSSLAPAAMIDRALYCEDPIKMLRTDFTDIDVPTPDPVWQADNFGGAGVEHDATRLVTGVGFGGPMEVVSLLGAGEPTDLSAGGGIAQLAVDRQSGIVLGISENALVPYHSAIADVVGTLGVEGAKGASSFPGGGAMVASVFPVGPTAMWSIMRNDATSGGAFLGGVNAGVIGFGPDAVQPLLSPSALTENSIDVDVTIHVESALSSILFPADVRPTYFAAAADGCVGLALVEAGAGDIAHAPTVDVFLVATWVCNPAITGASIVPLGTLALDLTPGVNDADVQSAKIVVHHDSKASLFIGNRIVLVDLADPTALRVAAVATVPPTIDANDVVFRDAGIDAAGPWIAALTTSDGTATVLELAPSPVASLLSSWQVPSGAPGRVMRQRVLAVLSPRAYLSAWDPSQAPETGHGLSVFDLTTTPPSLEETLPLASEPVDLVPFNSTLVVARFDGLSLVSPPCAPPP